MRVIGGIAGVVVLLAGLAAIWTYNRVHDLDVEQVGDDVFVIYGPIAGDVPLGGNVAVLATDEGAVIVDTMTFVGQGRRIGQIAERLGRGPVQAIVNTHYHLDHTHGNPAFPAGTKVIATAKTRQYMLDFDGDFWAGDAAGTLPNELFDDTHTLRVGGKTVQTVHVGPGHTGGDLVVLFVEDRVIHMGDLFFNGRYPNIDLEAGGSVRGWAAAIDRALELDFDRVIPGHGPVTDRAGLLAFQAFMRELARKVGAAADEGLSLEQTLDRVELEGDEGYRPLRIPFVVDLDRDFVVRRAWQEATGRAQ